MEPAFDGFGVLLSPGKMAPFAKEQAQLSSSTLEAIDRVCEFLGHQNVGHLERLATAAWIRTRENIRDPDAVARRLNELKPHISLTDARQADDEVGVFLE